MPYLDAAPIPAKKERGTEMTSAQGHDTTRKFSARYTHSDQSDVTAPGMTASKTAVTTTIGV